MVLTMTPLEIALARSVHVAFYVLLFAIPLSGWALGSAEDEPLRFFGAFDLPRVVIGSEIEAAARDQAVRRKGGGDACYFRCVAGRSFRTCQSAQRSSRCVRDL